MPFPKALFKLGHGDKPGRRNGWAVFNGEWGAFGNWRTGIASNWRMDGNSRSLTETERRALAEHARQREADRKAKQERARLIVADLWEASGPADPAHPYLARKGLGTHALHQCGDELLVPLVDAELSLWNVQRIGADGRKLFTPGARVSALFSPLGGFLFDGGRPATGPIVIAEGWATAAAIREATGLGAVAAMSAGNLLQAAQAIRQAMRWRSIIIAADWDGATIGNPGLTAGREAAGRVGALLALPIPAGAESDSHGHTIDFADLPRDECARLIRAAKGRAHG